MMQRKKKPYVSVVVPLRNSQENVGELISSLKAQDYGRDNFEIILVGNIDDQTWQAVDLDDPQIQVYEVELPEDPWFGRDANLKRNVGWHMAKGKVVIFTDAKIRQPPDWIRKAIALMNRENVRSVAGEMVATPESERTFMGIFTDHALIRRNPAFGPGYKLTKNNFGDRESLPITATWAIEKDALSEVAEKINKQVTVTIKVVKTQESYQITLSIVLNIDFRDSYEDYATAWELVRHEVNIFVTNAWQVTHKHRSGYWRVFLEYARSARGAGQMVATYEDCPFAVRRERQVKLVMRTLSFGLGTVLGTLVSWLFFQSEIAGLFVMLMAAVILISTFTLGTINIAKVYKGLHRVYLPAFVYPVMTIMFIFWFAVSFVIKLQEGGGKPTSNRWLQTMWSLLLRSLNP